MTTQVVERSDRADRAVARALGIARAEARALIARGAVRAASRRLRKGERLEAGTILTTEALEGLPVVAEPDLPLRVLLETPELVVLDKQAGMACHPLRLGELGTVANALVARYPECLLAGSRAREAGLCHRLDRETSGTLLAARSSAAHGELRRQFRAHAIEKVYLALVRGPGLAQGTIELPLASRAAVSRPHRGDRDGRPLAATTHYRRLWASAALALLEVRIVTGVRHQIRAHLAAIGQPLAGDVRFGGGAPAPGLDRHLLHARTLGFADPASALPLRVTAPLPADALAALDALGIDRETA